MEQGQTKEIYLDNASTTKTDPRVVDRMIPFYLLEYGNASSIHHKGQSAKEALENARKTIAERMGAKADEIVFTSGGTESDNMAIKGIAYLKKKGHIITSVIEHPAVLNTCKNLEKEGFEVTYIGVDKEGIVNVDALKKAIREDTILISIMHVNNEIGTIQPLEEIGKIAKEKGITFHSDAVQSFTKVPIDVEKMNLDLVSISSHKIHGPKGVGAIFIRKGVKLSKMSNGGHHEFNVRAGTENVPGIMGFATAVGLADERESEVMTVKRDKLIKGILESIPESFLNGSEKLRSPNNVNIGFKRIEGESILLHLDMHGICVSTGSACSSQSLKPSHVLLALGLRPEEAHGCIRFTLSRFTTDDEIDFTIEAIKEVVADLRNMSPM